MEEVNSLIASGVFTLDPNNGKITTALFSSLPDWFSRSVLAIDPSHVAFPGTKTVLKASLAALLQIDLTPV